MKNLKYAFDEKACATQWQQYFTKHHRMNIACICIAALTLLALVVTCILLLLDVSCIFALCATCLGACGLCITLKFDPKESIAARVHALTQEQSIKEFQYYLDDGYMDLYIWMEDPETGNVTRYRLPSPAYTYNSRVHAPTLNIAEGKVLLPYPPERNNHE